MDRLCMHGRQAQKGKNDLSHPRKLVQKGIWGNPALALKEEEINRLWAKPQMIVSSQFHVAISWSKKRSNLLTKIGLKLILKYHIKFPNYVFKIGTKMCLICLMSYDSHNPSYNFIQNATPAITMKSFPWLDIQRRPSQTQTSRAPILRLRWCVPEDQTLITIIH